MAAIGRQNMMRCSRRHLTRRVLRSAFVGAGAAVFLLVFAVLANELAPGSCPSLFLRKVVRTASWPARLLLDDLRLPESPTSLFLVVGCNLGYFAVIGALTGVAVSVGAYFIRAHLACGDRKRRDGNDLAEVDTEASR